MKAIGIILNADVNTRHGIIRKIISKAFTDRRDRALGLMPVSVRTLANRTEKLIKLNLIT